MKESEKKVVEESVNKTKYVSRSPSKEEVEKDGGEEVSVRQESQVSGITSLGSWALSFPGANTSWLLSLLAGAEACAHRPCRTGLFSGCSLSRQLNLSCSEWDN